MADPDEQPEKKVKELIDSATRADLERWFGLPSFEQLAERGQAPAPPKEEKPEWIAARKRTEEALAAVDPAVIEAHRRRYEPIYDQLRFRPAIDVRVDPGITAVDLDRSILNGRETIADPREVEIPAQLEEDLHTCTPQALLRDLHRPETGFHKGFEVTDIMAELRVDAARAVAEALKVRPGAPLPPSPFQQARELIRELRAYRRRPWPDIWNDANIANRPVTP